MDWHARIYGKSCIPRSSKEERKWRGLRRIVWNLADGYCERCGLPTLLYKGGASPHHIVPREKGGLDIPENLIWLCLDCHDYIEDNIEILSTRKLIISSYKPIWAEQNKITQLDNEINNKLDWHTWVYGGAKNPNV